MSIARSDRRMQRQMGQFLTPRPLARSLVAGMDLRREHMVLEPSMGDGSFVIPLIDRFMKFYRGGTAEKLAEVLRNNIYGVELDESLYEKCLQNIRDEWGVLPSAHNFMRGDFLRVNFRSKDGRAAAFDHVVGNPPFGGTIDSAHQDALDRQFGFRGGMKIKKETYSFFIVKSVELLRPDGRLTFICSDTFLTIKTMKGLRNFLVENGATRVEAIPFFSEEVSQRTVLLECAKGAPARGVVVNGETVAEADIQATPNHSWRINGALVKYFGGAKIGDFMTASSGMTVGKNEYFVRDIVDGEILEPYRFSFYRKPITIADAVARARLGKISAARRREIMLREAHGDAVRDVRISGRAAPKRIKFPHPDYCLYNKARKGIVYAPPAHAIFWRNDGDAVYTYKQNGNWYLHGVGGKKYFFREGLTWNLVASRLHLRYLPPGHVLDSGAPCAFLNVGGDNDEMFFILAWGLSDLCSEILKTTINHTQNIQGKDFERLPYPFWVDSGRKFAAVTLVKAMIKDARTGREFSFADTEMREINALFSGGDFNRTPPITVSDTRGFQMPLVAVTAHYERNSGHIPP